MATDLSMNSKDAPSNKRAKLDDDIILSGVIHDKIKDLSSFRIDKILNNNSNRKTVCLQGFFNGSQDTALVILEKAAFEDHCLSQDSDYFSKKCSLKKVFHNDIYGNYEFFPNIELNSIKTTIIYPATQKHIQKFSVQNTHIINETPEIYKNIILPHIKEEQFNLQWVYNIIDHKSEQERIVFEDKDPINGFVLLPDLKWNGTTLETLYLLAIVNIHDIKSLRDLTSEHLPLLKNIFDKGSESIENKYKLCKSQLRIYLHYQPSFYHLHVHFTYLKYEAPGISVEKAHMLSNVISNIELLPSYYQNISLPFIVRENENLFKKLEAKGLVKKVAANIIN